MRTAVLSDLHLGIGTGADMVRRADVAERLFAALDGVERVVLLGDVLELRDRPLADVVPVAGAFLEALAERVGEAEIVLVAGNHDHHLIESWLERRVLTGEPPLGLEQRAERLDGALALLAERVGGARFEVAYPGLWLRADVYATHGHFLDRHLTVPTFERLGVAAIERVLGIPPGEPDPLAPPEEPDVAEVAEYESVQAPVYALLHGLAQAQVGEQRGGASPSVRMWQMLGGGETRSARLRGWLLGAVALPGAIGVANRLGLGPVRPDLSARAIARASVEAMATVVERLGIEAEHVIFGHTHRRGPLAGDEAWTAGEARLWNTGSWVHAPGLLGRTAAESPYWPGTVCFVEDDAEPELVHLLDDWTRANLARA